MEYPCSPIPEKDLIFFKGDENLLDLHQKMRAADHEWRQAKAQGRDYGVYRRLAEDYIKAAYDYQRVRWGRVRCRMSVSALMR